MSLDKSNMGYAVAAPQALTNRVLRNTYLLLSTTLLFSAFTAWVSARIGFPYLGLFALIPIFGAMFMVHLTRNSVWGLLWTFVLTGFFGLTLGPVLSSISYISNGSEIIMLAMGGTGAIFFVLSGYVLLTRRNMSFMGGFVCAGLLVAFLAMIANFFLAIPALGLAISCAFMLLSSCLIMYETSRIIRGEETNYILATITLYVSLYNIFVSLLHLLTAFMGNND